MTTTTPVRAWHDSQELKDRTVARMRAHAEADRLIRLMYLFTEGGKWRGCLHGCLIVEDLAAEQGVKPSEVELPDDPLFQNGWHIETEARYGIVREVGSALDTAYEEIDLPPGDVAVRLLQAIPVGADLRGLGMRLRDALRDALERDYEEPLTSADEAALTAVCAILAAAPIVEVTR